MPMIATIARRPFFWISNILWINFIEMTGEVRVTYDLLELEFLHLLGGLALQLVQRIEAQVTCDRR